MPGVRCSSIYRAESAPSPQEGLLKNLRSFHELAFRVKQEAANLWMWIAAPSVSSEEPTPLRGMPAPAAVVERLRGTAFARQVEELADLALRHRFPLFGSVIEASDHVAWRRDYVNHIESGKSYFRFVPYLDFQRVGDHKVVWELNRHQHLILLALSFLSTGRREFVDEIRSQVESWLDANPFMRGINWASALEVAFRSLSWVWVYHLAGDALDGQ